MSTTAYDQTAKPASLAGALRLFFSQPSPQILLLVTACCVVARLVNGQWHYMDALIAAAILLFWPVLEWLIHVFMLHYKPITFMGRQIDFKLPQTHRDHHADPWAMAHVFIPLHIFPLVAPLIILGALLVLPTSLALTYLCVFFALALHYEWCHFLAHIRYCPPLAYYQRRVKLHRLHHFKNESLWWGVSMGAMDSIMGTAPDPETVDRTGSTRDISGC